MIAFLKGLMLRKYPDRVVMDVGGVGYEVIIPLTTFYEIGEPGEVVELEIHTHVREDTLALFGFLTGQEKRVFERLISISGIGPKLAVTVLSGLTPNALINAVRSGDRRAIQAVPGVGLKTAERVILEMRDRLDDLLAPEESASVPDRRPADGSDQRVADAISALENLGYRAASARDAVQAFMAKRSDEENMTLSLEDLLRGALGGLNR